MLPGQVHLYADKRPPSKAEHAEMAQSERLASLCEPLLKLRVGQRSDLPDWFSSMASGISESRLVERILVRLDEFATCWHALPVGGSVTLSWPSHGSGGVGRTRRWPGSARGRSPGTSATESSAMTTTCLLSSGAARPAEPLGGRHSIGRRSFSPTAPAAVLSIYTPRAASAPASRKRCRRPTRSSRSVSLVEDELFSPYGHADLETEAGAEAAREYDGFRFDTTAC